MPSPNQAPIRELFVSEAMAGALLRDAARLPRWILDPPQMRRLDLLMNGGFFPLKGYLTQADHQAVQEGLQLSSGMFWALPVSLEVDGEFAVQVEPGGDIALAGPDGALLAVMSVTDKWPADPRGEGPVRLGGPVKGLAPSPLAGTSPNARRAQGAAHVVALSTDDPRRGTLRRRLEAAGIAHLPMDPPPLPGCAGRLALMQAVLARNFGATELVVAEDLAGDALVARYGDRAGIAIVTEPGGLRAAMPGGGICG